LSQTAPKSSASEGGGEIRNRYTHDPR
jgi:hypothetical protein